jgi:hypothetical protein
MAEHNGWTPGDKAAYLTVTLNEHAAYILHSVPTGAMYKEITAVLENPYADHHLEEAFHAQLHILSREALPILNKVFLTLAMGRCPLKIWVFVANITNEFTLGWTSCAHMTYLWT